LDDLGLGVEYEQFELPVREEQRHRTLKAARILVASEVDV